MKEEREGESDGGRGREMGIWRRRDREIERGEKYPKILLQIFRTRAESQRIVAARPLCRLQYSVRAKSSTKDLPQ